MLYSKATGGFYTTEIHGDNIPADAVEISAALHGLLLAGQSAGKIIGADAFGHPALQDPPLPSIEQLKAGKNAEINTARAAANFSTFPHSGKQFACDQLSRSDIDGINGYIALHNAFPAAFPGAWKAVDNTYHALPDIAEWKSFYTSMVAAGSANFAHAQTLKAALAIAVTAEQVAAIVWGSP